MEDLQSGTLSTVCQTCTALDCWECDYAQLRWGLPEREQPVRARRLKEKAIVRYQRQIAEIDRQLEGLEKIHSAFSVPIGKRNGTK